MSGNATKVFPEYSQVNVIDFLYVAVGKTETRSLIVWIDLQVAKATIYFDKL